MKSKLIFPSMIFALLFAAACGTIATPEPEETALPTSEEQVAQIAAPTATSLPPTVAPTLLSATEVPTESPATPTEAESAAVVATATIDPLTVLVARFGDPARGDTIFHNTYDTAVGQWACATCHNTVSDDRLIGPGMLSLSERAGTRIPGLSAESYIWQSVTSPQDFIVQADPIFPENLMPTNYRDILSDQDLYDLIAYLLSLSEQ